jgi:integrase
MATPRQFRDGWRVQIQKDGQRVSKVFRTKREATQWVLAQEAKKTPLRSNTLRQAIERYLESVTPQKRNAEEWERRRLESFAAYFGDHTPLSDIDSDALAKWRDAMAKKVSGSTINRYSNLYRNLFRTAWKEWKWIDSTPWDSVKLPKENLPRDQIWRWQQIRRILREGQFRGGKTLEVTQAFHIALRTAMRLQESLGYAFDARRMIAIVPPSKTNAKPEEIPLTRQAVRLLSRMPKFTVGPNEASVLFSELCRQLMIEGLQFRDSRATALTLLAKRVDVLVLSRISRHRDLDMLSRVYFRSTAEELSKRLASK